MLHIHVGSNRCLDKIAICIPESPIVGEIVIVEEPENPKNSELKIALTAPEMAMVDVPFDISVAASNCIYIEWYINGEYDSDLANQINPEDWSEKVSDTKAVLVYEDESQLNGNSKEHDRAIFCIRKWHRMQMQVM